MSTFGVIVQQNRKSPSTVLTAHNSTGNRTFMCNTGKPCCCCFVFFSNVNIGTGTLRNVQILSLAELHSPNIKVNSAIHYLQLVFLKSKTDESPAVYVHKFTPIMVRNNFHLFVNKHVVCLTCVFTT